MSWAKINESTRSLLFSVAILGIGTAGLWFGAQFNKAEANTATTVAAAPSATFAGTGFGLIPDGPTGCLDTNPPSSRDITFAVTGITGSVSKVEVSNVVFNPQHTWATDVKAILIAPNGASHTLFGRTLATTSNGCGDSSPLAGPYAFADTAAAPPSGGWWQATTAATGTTPVASGTYRTTNAGGAGATNPMPATSMNPSFTGVTNANGTWTLRFTDHGGGDTGTISSATLLVEGATVVPSYQNMDMDGDGKTDFVVGRGTDTPLTENESVSTGTLNRGVYTVRERLAKDREIANFGETGHGTFGETNQGNLAPAITWYTSINGSGATQVGSFGDSATDFFVPNDYDGDRKTDLAVWRPGAPFTAAFYILQSSNNTVRTDIFGQTGDDPAITGDYDGDGKADTATFRCPAFGAGDGQCFFFYRPSNPVVTPAGIWVVPWGFGEDGDFFVNPGDFDGDGKHDFCIQRANPASPTSGQFVLLKSNGFGVEFINWGSSSDFIIPGDYDGDGKDDFCVRRTISGVRQHFILERDGGGTGPLSPIPWGITNDVSAPGDYDGDGKQDIAVWRPNATPSANFFHVLRSSDGAIQSYEWGQQNDIPPASWYVH